MTNHKPSSSGKRRAQPKRQSATRGKQVRVEPSRRRRVDPDMIALCYWLIAQRIVEEAADDSDAAGQADASTDTHTPADDRATRSVS
jgi:hypothetical protein